MNDNRPIGVFDSGIGGLTVLEELIKRFPGEDFVYVADQGHCPYGTKTDEQIISCVYKVVDYLLKQNVKAIVIACNTASLFVDKVKAYVNIPVISVIEPTAAYASRVTKNKKIAVLATIATIKKGAYQNRLSKLGIEVYPLAASEFVDFVENHDLNDPLGDEIVSKKLEELKNSNIDTLIHGCTHFSILEDKMRKVLENINYVACGYPTSLELENILKEKDIFNNSINQQVKIYTTGSVENAVNTMKWFKAKHEPIIHIDID